MMKDKNMLIYQRRNESSVGSKNFDFINQHKSQDVLFKNEKVPRIIGLSDEVDAHCFSEKQLWRIILYEYR